MSGIVQSVRHMAIAFSVVIIVASHVPAAQQIKSTLLNEAIQGVDRLALIGDVTPNQPSQPAASNEPLPFSPSTLASDMIPPFAAHPDLQPIKQVSYEEPITFDDNISAKELQPKKVESVDDCCEELTAMIAGNLESDISLDAKTRMIETALKMIARNVALKAEAKITKLRADHALEMAQMQGQMMQMRSTATAADQINRVAGPLHQMLEKNFQQSVAMTLTNQKVSQMFAQLGMKQLEDDAREARANRQRIQLRTPSRPKVAERPSPAKQRIERLNEELLKVQQRLEAEYRNQQTQPNEVRPAAFNQPLQPRRQPLEPIRRMNPYYSEASQAVPYSR